MRSVEDLVEQARHLPVSERRRLLDELEELLDEPEADEEEASPPGRSPYARSLALAGTMHSDFTDVSSDKYRHVAAAALDQDEDK
jgi:hypothetical protein